MKSMSALLLRMGAAISPRSTCKCNRLDLLYAFISSFSTQPVSVPRRSKAGPTHSAPRRSFLSSLTYWRNPAEQHDTQNATLPGEQTLQNGILEASIKHSRDGLSADTVRDIDHPRTPWYLQITSPQHVSDLLLERQRIPELPPGSPPLLKPMLDQISIDLGLDNLTILDLRDMDPPPALGANLLMVVGTARSEKHLHVSADRFCRWLKTGYKLKPYADGLLGRGELKLKMRRKARRAKLLSIVGSSEKGSVDDGIRSGWICVNVGIIQDERSQIESFAGQEGYVGFGGEAGGARLVIQMLTEEKREELDLEGLWGKIVKNHEGEKRRIARGNCETQLHNAVAQS